MTGWYKEARNPTEGTAWHKEPERFERAHPVGAVCTCGFEKPYEHGHAAHHWRVTPLGHKLFAYALEHGDIDELTIAVAKACE